MKSKKHLWSVPILAMLTLAALGLALCPAPAVRQEGASPAPLSHGQADLARLTKPQVSQGYGKLPLSFEANRGQTDRQVKFLSRGSGYTLFLTANETVLSLNKPAAPAAQRRINTVAMRQEVAENKAVTTTVLRMRLVGANATPQVEGVEELSGKCNYFIGNDPKKWRTNVPSYAKVRYRAVYPGVDLVYYGNQRELEYDFVVAPGSAPQAIRLGIQGAKKVVIDAQGDLVLRTGDGDVRLRKPAVYQEVDGTRQPVAGHYVLRDNRQAGFEVGAYDASRPLVIDPVLSYSTYLGSSGFDQGQGIAVDSSGSAYVTGTTVSTNFPTTSGAFQTTAGGNSDAFVTKLNAAGSALVYSTYLGGGANDEGHAIAVDSAGSAYVTGRAECPFPTTVGAFQTTCPGTTAFVTKLNATGSALVYSTFLGGGGDGIAVDSAGSAYVTGSAGSTFPTTSGAFQTTLGGSSNVSVTKLNAAGSALVYSTYLGGSSFDFGLGIAVDSAGSAYVTGQTFSTNFPTTSGAFQTTGGGTCGNPGFTSPCPHALVAKLNSAGSALVYSTYLGGSSSERGSAIAVDSAGSAYVTGSTNSSDFPTTPGAFQTISRGGVFVTKLNAAGSALVYSTYLGSDQGFGIAVDSAGNAYVTGNTSVTNFPTVSPIQATNASGGCCDAFVTKLNPTGSALVFSTYLGGSGVDQALGIAVDSAGSAYVTGRTNSTNFPTTSGAFQTTYGGGGSDAFVAKIASIVPFASFMLQGDIKLGPPGAFDVRANFTLGVGSNGINAVSEDVKLQVGTFSTAIPAGSFKQDTEGRFKFEGVISGVTLDVQIVPLGGNQFGFGAQGVAANLTGTANPMTAALTIGNDGGSVIFTAEFN